MAGALSSLYDHLKKAPVPAGRPFVTLAYAQTLDGSIAAVPGRPTQVSGRASMEMAHRLRALHDGILVGIGTVLADDPQLTVRHVAGANPQPVILDSSLRTPANAHLMRTKPAPWIAHHNGGSAAGQALERAGATLLALPPAPSIGLDLTAVLAELRSRGVRRLMVEGGSAIIRSFLRDHLVDTLVLTIAPRILGGLRPLADSEPVGGLPQLTNPAWVPLDPDVVVWSPTEWSAA